MPRPDRWDDYSAMGTVIPGTQFLAFKVPLKEALLRQCEEENRFSPQILVQYLKEKNLELGGVIDLTFTTKYYDKEEFSRHSIDHAKVFVAGKIIPSENVFRKFAAAVREFSKDGKLVGVHCTHGLNRTGYLICRYMIEEMNIKPSKAIKLFNDARGHDIERENYLEDLSSRTSGTSCIPESDREDSFDWRSLPCDANGGHFSKKKKPRWRHNKDEHPDWRKPKTPSQDEHTDSHALQHAGFNFRGSHMGANSRHAFFDDRDGATYGYGGSHQNYNGGFGQGGRGGLRGSYEAAIYGNNGPQNFWNSRDNFHSHRSYNNNYSHSQQGQLYGGQNSARDGDCRRGFNQGRNGSAAYDYGSFRHQRRDFKHQTNPYTSSQSIPKYSWNEGSRYQNSQHRQGRGGYQRQHRNRNNNGESSGY